jgi:hypothetical protein
VKCQPAQLHKQESKVKEMHAMVEDILDAFREEGDKEDVIFAMEDQLSVIFKYGENSFDSVTCNIEKSLLMCMIGWQIVQQLCMLPTDMRYSQNIHPKSHHSCQCWQYQSQHQRQRDSVTGGEM